jgi:branched-chain amino acid aminotransferase
MEVVERPIDRSELYTADEVFLTGTAAHIQGIGSVDYRLVGKGGVGPVTKQLQDLYFPIVRGRNPKYRHQLTVAAPKVPAS